MDTRPSVDVVRVLDNGAAGLGEFRGIVPRSAAAGGINPNTGPADEGEVELTGRGARGGYNAGMAPRAIDSAGKGVLRAVDHRHHRRLLAVGWEGVQVVVAHGDRALGWGLGHAPAAEGSPCR